MPQYIPFAQQPYCCVPASLQSVLYRRGIPIIPQEDLAYELGLIVPPEKVALFKRARTGDRPAAGWGTQIQLPEFEINSVFNKLCIPLHVNPIMTFASVDGLRLCLQEVMTDNDDALLCFDTGVLWDTGVQGGHVCVFNGLDGDTVWLIDPEPGLPKNRETTLEQLYKAIDFHGPENSCGVWRITSATLN